ncbi:TetR/AcrR family transcriptional regulator [Croceicoccus sp. F390]|uniref:TetR/AcrR family transcriptional regulator n=1 Tax=Croceicoccus esteveae TaxID=3075597 RepID=A0ABU2ZKE9_9SPHN|nr:TetR/AcrR family transcriptional regulator [Croceicoccus sp. F390]MDT0575882.1 TetR/AcrR family transcriptional regulator [Croceicoccus sp. F390]
MTREPPPAKLRILAAAEQLVAEQGFDAVSTRDIVARAQVNIAAVNYYFGSKQSLLLEIFATRAAELNRERATLLARVIDKRPDDVRAIMHALFQPTILWNSEERRLALRFLNRARREGPLEVRETIRTDVRHLYRFVDALANALPQMPHEELLWRFHFALGALHHNQPGDYERLIVLSDGACRPDDQQRLLDHLLDFVARGFGV